MTVICNNIKLPTRTLLSALQPIFVIGCPRSGTTVVGECIGAHPAVQSVGESLFVRYIWVMIVQLSLGGPTNKLLPFKNIDHQGLVDSAGAFIDDVFGLLNRSKRPMIVDHTPWNIAHIPLLRAIYPQCRFIHLVRHPIAVSASLTNSFKNGRHWASDDPIQHAQLWRKLNQCVNEIPTALMIKQLRYEDFCLEPEITLKSLADFCDLPWSADMLAPLAAHHAASSTAEDTSGCLAQIIDNHLVLVPQKKMPADTRCLHWPDNVREEFFVIVAELANQFGYRLNS